MESVLKYKNTKQNKTKINVIIKLRLFEGYDIFVFGKNIFTLRIVAQVWRLRILMSDSYEYWSTANCNDGSWQKGIAYRAMWITKNIYDAKWSRKIRISIRLVFTVLATVSSWWKPSMK